MSVLRQLQAGRRVYHTHTHTHNQPFDNQLERTYSLCGISSSGSAITVDVLSLQINKAATIHTMVDMEQCLSAIIMKDRLNTGTFIENELGNMDADDVNGQ